MGASRYSLVVAVIGIAGAFSAAASAQETIFDPENPAVLDDEPQDDDSEDGEAGESDSDTARQGFDDTEWTLDYDLTTLVDPGTGPTGRDALEIVGGMGMRLRHDHSEATRLVAAGRFDYWAGAGRRLDDWRTLYEPRLDRAYVVHRTDSWSISMGQMRNRWGSTDIIAPGDVIDPVDLRNPVAGDGFGTSRAQLSAAAAYVGDDWSLRAVVVPFFEGHRATLFGRDTALAHERNPLVGEQLPFLLLAEQLLDPSIQQEVQPFLQATQRPRALPKNVSAGLRATATISGTDLGAGIFFGWDRTPDVTLDDDLRSLLVLMAEDGQVFEDYDFAGFMGRNPEAFDHSQRMSEKAEAGETLFGAEIRRRATLLVDGARYIGPIGVRADVAFSPQRVFFTTDFEAVRRAAVHAAVGLSHERLLDGIRPLAVTVEGFWLHPFSQQSAIHRAFGSGEDAGGELVFFEGGYYGVATAANWATGLWDLELAAGGITSVSPGDVIGRVAIERGWRQGFRTAVGANVFWGPDPSEQLSPGGLWAHNDRVYLTVSGQF